MPTVVPTVGRRAPTKNLGLGLLRPTEDNTVGITAPYSVYYPINTAMTEDEETRENFFFFTLVTDPRRSLSLEQETLTHGVVQPRPQSGSQIFSSPKVDARVPQNRVIDVWSSRFQETRLTQATQVDTAVRHSSQFKNYFTEMCSGSEAGSYFRCIDFCITQL